MQSTRPHIGPEGAPANPRPDGNGQPGTRTLKAVRITPRLCIGSHPGRLADAKVNGVRLAIQVEGL